MKKILIAFIVAFASFSSAFAAEYDFTSAKALDESMVAQGVKEGFAENVAYAITDAYSEKLVMENSEELMKSFESAKSEADIEALLLAFAKKHIGEKSIKEMKAYVEKDGTVITIIDYDYSSEEALMKSMIAQGAKEGLSEEEVGAVFSAYMEMVVAENEAAFKKLLENLKDEKEINAALLVFVKEHLGFASITTLKERVSQD